MKIYKIIFTHLICLVILLLSHNPALGITNLHSQNFTSANGICSNYVRSIVQDKTGFLWMGTLNGICRYDGYTFENFRYDSKGKYAYLLDNRIQKLEIGAKGLLWVKTRNDHYCCYDLNKGRFCDYTGCGRYRQQYKYHCILPNGDFWGWNKEGGCVNVNYNEGHFTSRYFDRKHGRYTDVINFISQDINGYVWVGTNCHLYLYNYGKLIAMGEKGNYTAYCINKATPMFITADGKIYVADKQLRLHNIYQPIPLKHAINNVTKAIMLFNRVLIITKTITFEYDVTKHQLMASKAIQAPNGDILYDNLGNTVITLRSGKIWYLDRNSRAIIPLDVYSIEQNLMNGDPRYCVITDKDQNIWVSTYGNGLFIHNKLTGNTTHITQSFMKDAPINSNYLMTMMLDQSDNIWISQENQGVTCVSTLLNGATMLYVENRMKMDRSNSVRMIERTTDGILWIGNQNGGLYTMGSNDNIVKRSNPFNNDILSVYRDRDGVIWMGSRSKGLLIGDKHYQHNPKDPNSISSGKVNDIVCDRHGRVWVSIFGGGLDLALRQSDGSYRFHHYFNKTAGMREVRVIKCDHLGNLWVGTSIGAIVFNTDRPSKYHVYNLKDNGIGVDDVRAICEDRHNRVWIGTISNGVGYCDNTVKGLRRFKEFSTKEGLVYNSVESLLEDTFGNIWIATDYGISCFVSETGKFRNFFFSTTSVGNLYNENSAVVINKGNLLFGTKYGLVKVDRDILYNVRNKFHFAFTDMLINGVSVYDMGNKNPLDVAIDKASEIKLDYNQNSITVYFSDFDFVNNRGSKYSYKLDGYNDKWSALSDMRFAMFRDLPPGHYTLHVRSYSSNGICNPNQLIMSIIINPPFWATFWAYLIYTIFIITTGYLVYRQLNTVYVLHNRIRVEKELTEYKLKFFTNISHEFRTPLTLIQGAMERIRTIDSMPSSMKQPISNMNRSVTRLLRLVNQLLEFRKMQDNRLSLALEKTDIITFVNEISMNFRDVAENREIAYSFLPFAHSFEMYIDKNFVDKVLYNILSNAFKYTPQKGSVDLKIMLSDDKNAIRFVVTDTGVGIPKDKQSELFERFMQSSFSNDSIGIGLYLTHELVRVHHGTIRFDENPVGGSIFTVELPVDINVYDKKDFLVGDNVLIKEEHDSIDGWLNDYKEMADEPMNMRKVLVIDDDDDVRWYLQAELSKYFIVSTATDGKNGIEELHKNVPDLTVCDVLMPQMNGYEFTKYVKGSQEYMHIPIILLTALSDEEKQMKGIVTGADAYISKPFSPNMLIVQCRKMIEQRDKLLATYAKKTVGGQSQLPDIIIEERDRKFLDKLNFLVESRFADPAVSIDELAKIMGYGRSSFYKKVKSITGYTPNDYLRKFRMEKAVELLLDEHINISEVAYKVGINDPMYFSRCFKAAYGISPLKYQQGERNIK
jgi:signal transduction histidine kinase/ligand-binding sensor domain-containing protein/CheY-like chemotaxis protein/AraC-like DNA-binding protein